MKGDIRLPDAAKVKDSAAIEIAIAIAIAVALTAGSAKKDMPRRAQQEAINLPCQVMGTMSP